MTPAMSAFQWRHFNPRVAATSSGYRAEAWGRDPPSSEASRSREVGIAPGAPGIIPAANRQERPCGKPEASGSCSRDNEALDPGGFLAQGPKRRPAPPQGGDPPNASNLAVQLWSAQSTRSLPGQKTALRVARHGVLSIARAHAIDGVGGCVARTHRHRQTNSAHAIHVKRRDRLDLAVFDR